MKPENSSELSPAPHLSTKQRSHAVARLLDGEDVTELATELGVTTRQIELWTKEFCRAGDMRLRQLPDNGLERCLTAVEKLVPLATLVSVLLAVTLFIQGQRKEAAAQVQAQATARESRVHDAYTSLDDKYLDYVKVCLDHPDLDVSDTPMLRTAPPTRDQQRREAMVFSMLISVLERAYLMYGAPTDAFEKNQWTAWSAYMKEWTKRPNFHAEWVRTKSEYDANFGAYVDTLFLQASATTAPAPVEN